MSASASNKFQPLLTPDNNTPFDNNVDPPRKHDHTVAFDGGPGVDPLHATQASLIDPRVAPATTISPDDLSVVSAKF